MNVRKTLVAGMAVAALGLAAAPAPAAETTDGCFLGSPNIVRDVTDCAAYVLEGTNGCFIGSPNIIRDVTDCATYIIEHLAV